MYRNMPILYRALESFFRYRILFLISVCVVTVIPAAVILTRQPTYTSTALIQVVVEDVTAALGETNRNYNWTSVAQQNVNRFNDWMSDDSPGGFVDLALQQSHLRLPISIDPRARDQRLARLHKALSVTPASDTVFAINLVWDNATECEQIVKALQAQYIERIGKNKQAQSLAVEQFLDGEREKYAGRLRIAEQAVIDFKRNNAGQSPEAQSASMDQLSQLRIQLNSLDVTSHNNDLKRDVIQKRLAQIKPTSILEQRITDSPVRDSPFMIQKSELEAKRNSLLAEGYLLTSTRVQALEAQIASLKQSIAAELKSDPARAKSIQDTLVQDNPEYRDLQRQATETTIEGNTDQAQMVQLRERIAEYEARLERLPMAEAQMNDRMRDFTILKGEYEDLVKRREQARIKSNLDKVAASSTLQQIGVVYAQTANSKTKTAMMLAGLVSFGLILGIGVTVLAEWADPSLRFAGDVQRRLGVPVLISLPELAPLRLVTSAPGGETSDGRPLLPARNE